MTCYAVVTVERVRRVYWVTADDPKEAERKFWDGEESGWQSGPTEQYRVERVQLADDPLVLGSP